MINRKQRAAEIVVGLVPMIGITGTVVNGCKKMKIGTLRKTETIGRSRSAK